MKDQLTSILDRVRNWPKDRQEDAVELLKLIEDHDHSPYRLTDEQAAEIRRRLAATPENALSLAQLDDRLRLLGV